VSASFGTEGVTAKLRQALEGASRVLIAFDPDEAGDRRRHGSPES